MLAYRVTAFDAICWILRIVDEPRPYCIYSPFSEAIVWSRIMKVLLEDRALHGNRLVARKFGKSRFKNDKMGHFRRPCVNYSQEKRPGP